MSGPNPTPTRPAGVRVSVPATSANLGPGFDVLGLALDLVDVFEVWETGTDVSIEVDGEGAGTVPTDRSNLFHMTLQKYFDAAGYETRGLRIREHNRIPLARGLGSSAATIVGALVAARAVSGSPIDDDRLLDMAVSLEGHPDNVAAALRGGFVMVADEGDGRYLARDLAWSDRLGAALFIPDLLVATESARQVLPEQYSRADAVHNLGRLAMLLAAIGEARIEDLRIATQDRLHQPYRSSLVPGLAEMIAAANEAGAGGAFLSGAGPTVLALHDRTVEGLGDRVAAAMAGVASGFGLHGRTLVLDLRSRGAEVEDIDGEPAAEAGA
ncbi:MAG TPA: homoserine kinase [Candidatus Solibacter sp.]|nr:homoserine kinase [Candidatus Solibacter sp.]